MSGLHAIQLLLLAALVALAFERARSLAFVGACDGMALTRAIRQQRSLEAAHNLCRALGASPVSRVAAAWLSALSADAEIDARDTEVNARAEVSARLGLLRIGATLSSFLGLAGAAQAIFWIHGVDHGLLDLDPTRVTAAGTFEAALCIALGIGGSSFALGSFVVLSRRARATLSEMKSASGAAQDLVLRLVETQAPAPPEAVILGDIGAEGNSPPPPVSEPTSNGESHEPDADPDPLGSSPPEA